MLRLPPLELLTPISLEEAVSLLEEGSSGHHPESKTMVVAGGTDLYPNIKRRQFTPTTLVAVNRIPELRTIRGSDESGWTLGSAVTLTETAGRLQQTNAHHALTQAASLVSSPPIQNMATIGGNLLVDTRCNYYNQTQQWRQAVGYCMKRDGEICLVAPSSRRCWALSSTDSAPAAIVLGAEVELRDATSARMLPVERLYANDGIEYLTMRPTEILVSIRLPPLPGWRSTYLKLRRRGSIDFPLLGVAVAARVQEGIISQARLVLGAMASHPIRLLECERLLLGQRPTEELIDATARLGAERAKPLDNADLVYHWRKRMVSIYLRRALSEVLEVP